MLTSRARTIYNEYPRPFWVLMLAAFIDRLGGAILFPFFALYVTAHFGVGMKEVGVLFFIFSVSALLGNVVAGALTDRLGRKTMLLAGLVLSALSTVVMALINDLLVFYAAAAVIGFLGEMGGPAVGAIIADLLPEGQRTEGFGVQRVVINVAVALGPAIGGFVAGYSYLFVFLADAVTSVLTAVVVLLWLPETKPAAAESDEPESVARSFRSYGAVLRDVTFMGFLLASMLVLMAYGQMYSTLSVFLRDAHGLPPSGYGWLLSINAALVVALQFWVSRRVSRIDPLRAIVLACLFYAVGFGMYGFVGGFALFIVAMVLITFGEMIHLPVAHGVAATLAPEHMRGRYMAVFSFSFIIPNAIAPYLAGIIMDDIDPFLVWYAAAGLALLGGVIFWGLSRRATPGGVGET